MKSSLPRPARAPIIDFPRQPMSQQTSQRQAQVYTWHKAPNRMSDPRFLSLSPVAMAALRNLDELALTTRGPIVGKQGQIASMLGVEPKHFYLAITPLVDAGFIVLQPTANVLSIVLQPVPNDTPTGVQPVSNRNKETANDAGSGDRPLKETKSTSNEVQTETQSESTPLPPEGGQGQPSVVQVFAWAPTKTERGPAGKPKPETAVTVAKVAEWRATYPDIDVEFQISRCIQWLRDNPLKQGPLPIATIGNWLGKAAAAPSQQTTIGGIGNGTSGRTAGAAQAVGASMVGDGSPRQPRSLDDIEL